MMHHLHAHYVIPVSGPPIENGCVTIEGSEILAVGKAASCAATSENVIDYDRAAIVPGLVNAHTHLEFSLLEKPLGGAGISMVEWIQLLLDYRGKHPMDQKASIASGLRESLSNGITTVGEIAFFAFEPAVYGSADMPKGVLFQEIISPIRSRFADAGKILDILLEASSNDMGGWKIGVSPHAPYSIAPEALETTAAFSRANECPLAMHLAESPEEMQFLQTSGGSFRTFLEKRGSWDGSLAFDQKRPMDYLRLLSEASRALIVHGNYLDDEEIAFLAAHADRMGVAYCPRTHDHFRHSPYPLEKMLAAGVCVALGTDSRASSLDLNLWADMRRLAEKHPTVSKQTLLELGTKNGAAVLGLDRECGTIEPGKHADLAVFKLPEVSEDAGPYATLFHEKTKIQAVWLRGKRL